MNKRKRKRTRKITEGWTVIRKDGQLVTRDLVAFASRKKGVSPVSPKEQRVAYIEIREVCP